MAQTKCDEDWPVSLESEGWSLDDICFRNKETREHTLRVAEMTTALAKMAGISGIEATYARNGALLHDIGHLGIPDGILLKPGKLSSDEWKVMRRHPEYAYDLIYPIDYLRPCLSIPYSHHEKWDGTGYPLGLKGEEISLQARLFAIVDVWDTLSSSRIYRQAWGREEVLHYIKLQSGIHFDPHIVELFLRAVKGMLNVTVGRRTAQAAPA